MSLVPVRMSASSNPKVVTIITHPATSEMVKTAILNLRERGGSTLAAIKKNIAATFKVDVRKLAPFVDKYVVTAVEAGVLAKGKAKGTFKMAVAKEGTSTAPSPAIKKTTKGKATKAKKTQAKRKAAPKKTKAKKTTKKRVVKRKPKVKKK